jgi:dTDP-glucose 4,6-dehydratase
MKILVTGGRGFIGRALVKQLREKGHDVWSLDLLHHPDPRHLRADTRSYTSLEAAVSQGFELVYHLAAEAGRWNGESHYESLWTTNVIGTKHLIRLQERYRFRMVFMSSSEVYGDYDGVMSEDVMDHVAIRQLNDYAMTKWVGEMQVMNSAAMFGTESVRIRMFNVYGPGEPYGANRGVVARFIWHALHGLPYTVYLNHHRTSTYLDDIIRSLAALVERFRPGAVYNLGGLEYHDIKTLSDLILEQLGLDDRLVAYAEGEAFTTKDKKVDMSRAIHELGHDPRVSLREGIARTVAWARTAYLEES